MDRVIDGPALRDVLAWDSGVGLLEACFGVSLVFLVELRALVVCACDERRMWITCRWLNLSVC